MQLTPKHASIALVIGGCMWGIYWLPLTHLEGQGLTGATAGIALYVACLVLLVPAIWRNRALFIIHYKALLFSGILTGAAFSLFSTSLAYTDVIRTILLFYLTPVWGVILGAIFLKERVTPARSFVILCAFAGLYVILGGDGGLPVPRNIGDVFALSRIADNARSDWRAPCDRGNPAGRDNHLTYRACLWLLCLANDMADHRAGTIINTCPRWDIINERGHHRRHLSRPIIRRALWPARSLWHHPHHPSRPC